LLGIHVYYYNYYSTYQGFISYIAQAGIQHYHGNTYIMLTT